MNRTRDRCCGSLTRFMMERMQDWGVKQKCRTVARGTTFSTLVLTPERTRFLLRHAVRQPPSLTAFINNRAGSPARFPDSFPPPPKP